MASGFADFPSAGAIAFSLVCAMMTIPGREIPVLVSRLSPILGNTPVAAPGCFRF